MTGSIQERFAALFGRAPTHLFSAPGRTELGGNHTDHQHGRVLAAAVDLETCAAVRLNGTSVIRLTSEGIGTCTVDTADLSVRTEEVNTAAALVRGICAAFAGLGARVAGFDAYVTSQVPVGSGLSSSASFEVLMGTAVNTLFWEGKADAVRIARIGQWAENRYFGKPCGLMDQTACSVGSVISIDFKDTEHPAIERIGFDFQKAGYTLCILDTGASHADLTGEYAAIPGEMGGVCRLFGKTVLREIPEEDFYLRLGEVRRECGDRAALRCIHFYDEDRRVALQVEALRRGDIRTYLDLMNESGISSWTLLQNVVPAGSTQRQEVALALALAKKLLNGKGACRVHGGGFAGTIQALVPNEQVQTFRAGAEAVLGEGSCHLLNICPLGGRLMEELHD